MGIIESFILEYQNNESAYPDPINELLVKLLRVRKCLHG